MEKYIPLSEIANLTPYTADYLALLAGRGRLKAVQKDRVWYSTVESVNEYVVWLNNQMEAMQGSFKLPVSSFKTEESKSTPVMLEGAPATDSIHLDIKMDSIVPPTAPLQNDTEPQPSRLPPEASAKGGNLKLETDNFLSLQEAAAVSPYSADYISLRIRQGKIQATKRGGKWFTKLAWINEYVAEHGAKESSESRVSSFKTEEPVVASPEIGSSKLVVGNRNWKLDIGQKFCQFTNF